MPPGHAHIHVRGVPVRVGGQGGAGAGRAAPSEEERISRAAREQQGEVQRRDREGGWMRGEGRVDEGG